jgi:thiamine-monophosphate kinase
VHFDPAAPPERVGHKAVARVLSDIAAMGGEPRWALLDVVAPAPLPVATLEAVYRGAARVARRHGLAIVGGDLATGPVLELHAFALGAVARGGAVRRAGARPGDRLFVTGRLGGSLQGHHLRFRPRVREGRWLRSWATAMIDVSDGLATDLRHLIAASGVGALLDTASLPVSSAARRMGDGRPAVDHALYDGEDFELLFTIPAARQAAFRRAWRRAFRLACTPIGVITGRRGAILCRDEQGRVRPLRGRGYEHFRTALRNRSPRRR